jgi:hypothetical protein
MRNNLIFGRKAALLFFSVSIFLSLALPVFAQSGFSIILYPPEIDQFPKVTLFVDAFDAQRKFIPGLDLNSFTVLEDGLEIPVNETQIMEPGLHTIVAVNLGATLSNRANASVPTRFESVVFNLASWLNTLESTAANQYSLTSNEGILVEKLQEKDTFTYQLQNYKPNLFNFEPDLTSLKLALDIAAKPNLIPNSKQSILYITPLPLDEDLPEINSLFASAQEARVAINVWLMAPETAVNSPAAASLNQLAASTGGRFLIYTEQIQPPDPEEYLGALRSIYRLRYTSALSQSGAHAVRVRAVYGDQEASSPDTPFSIDLNLPTAVFIDLPNQIDRKFTNTGNGRELQPGFVTLQAEVVFPDGYSRQLEATRLYVDGELVAENTSAPFNFFGWELEEYNFSGEHLLAIEVQDILGFRNISVPRVVMINIESLYPKWLTAFFKFFNTGGWILFAFVGLGGTILLTTRIRNRHEMRAQVSALDDEVGSLVDPLLQTVPGLTAEGPVVDDYGYQAPKATIQEAAPFLKQVGKTPQAIQGRFIVPDGETTIGSDPQSANLLLAHPSVSQTHSRLQKIPSGSVTIADLRSTSGTWVNYAPISTVGTVLKNGDLIKIGEFTFRYYLGLDDKNEPV